MPPVEDEFFEMGEKVSAVAARPAARPEFWIPLLHPTKIKIEGKVKKTAMKVAAMLRGDGTGPA